MSIEPDVPSYRRNLPHIHPVGATFFVTFRLANSIPLSVLLGLKAERETIKKRKIKLTSAQAERLETAFHRRSFAKVETILHQGASGPHWLKDPAVADCVLAEIKNPGASLYALHACCVMSNHVHAVIQPSLGVRSKAGLTALAEIMQRIKGRTSLLCNRILKRAGQFWERETFDHVVRNVEQHRRIVAYVLNNPVKCRLVDCWQKWRWNFCSPEFGS
jgi:putative transposase